MRGGANLSQMLLTLEFCPTYPWGRMPRCSGAKRWVLAMLACSRSKLRVAPVPPLRGASDSPCAPLPSEPVGTKGVHEIQPCASDAGRTKGNLQNPTWDDPSIGGTVSRQRDDTWLEHAPRWLTSFEPGQ